MKTCDECETVKHCLEHGCVPKQPAPVQPVAWMSASRFEELQKGFTVMTTLTKQRAFEDDVAIHTTPPAAKRLEAAILAEREACAKYAENHDLGTPDGHDIAAAIRARGNT